MGRLLDRPTADVIVIFLTVIVGAILVCTSIVGLILQVKEHDSSNLWTFEGEVIKSFTAIIIGYIAGRGVSGTNGKS